MSGENILEDTEVFINKYMTDNYSKMMYSYEDLKATKYAELLIIAKSMQLKCGRKKGEKVIQLILEYQEKSIVEELKKSNETDGSVEMIEDIECPELSLLSADEKYESPRSIIKNDKKNEKFGKRKRSIETISESQSAMVMKSEVIRRSNTFVIDKPTSKMNDTIAESAKHDIISPSVVAKSVAMSNIRTSSCRSLDVENVKSPSKRRRISLSKSAPIIKSPDLTCSEIMTASDIKEVEESPLNPAFKSINKRIKPDNLASRQSLRGHLLSFRLAKRISSFDAIPAPIIRERANKGNAPVVTATTPVAKAATEKTLNNSCLRYTESRGATISKQGSPKPWKFELKSGQTAKTPVKDNVKTGIPRFVAYGRKIKIPNFARIHQKNFEKMEAVDDYLERRQLEAKNAQRSFCLSSTKKIGSALKPTVTSPKKINLNFTNVFSSSKTTARKPADLSTSKITPNKSAVNKSARKTSMPKCNTSTTLKQNNAKENRFPAVKTKKLNFSNVSIPMTGTGITDTRVVTRPQAKQTGSFKPIVKKGPKVISNAERRAKESEFLKGVRLNKGFELQVAKRGVKLN